MTLSSNLAAFSTFWLPFHLALLGPCIFASNQLKLFYGILLVCGWKPLMDILAQTAPSMFTSGNSNILHCIMVSCIITYIDYFTLKTILTVCTKLQCMIKKVSVFTCKLCAFYFLKKYQGTPLYECTISNNLWQSKRQVRNKCNNCNVLFTTIYSKQKTSEGKIVTCYL